MRLPSTAISPSTARYFSRPNPPAQTASSTTSFAVESPEPGYQLQRHECSAALPADTPAFDSPDSAGAEHGAQKSRVLVPLSPSTFPPGFVPGFRPSLAVPLLQIAQGGGQHFPYHP